VDRARSANTAMEILTLARACGVPLAERTAAQALRVARDKVAGETALEVVVFDRAGTLIGRAS
jgi:cobalt-precorrin-5B (C1)-methyltransferase